MNVLLLIANLALWVVVLFLGFLLLGVLRAVALLRWRVAQLEATTPSRLGRSGLRPGKKAPDFRTGSRGAALAEKLVPVSVADVPPAGASRGRAPGR
jgi:hypothetical protein